MKVIVGLGNPLSEYEKSRHNLGFQVLDRLGEKEGGRFKKARYQALEALIQNGEVKTLLVKPQTYMNLSGEAVVGVLRYYKITPEALLVVHDDLDLPLGRLKFSQGGSSGGHNGLESIISILDTPEFPRLRMGIGRPPSSGQGAHYVLSPFSEGEEPLVKQMIDLAVEAVHFFLKNGLQAASNRFNGTATP